MRVSRVGLFSGVASIAAVGALAGAHAIRSPSRRRRADPYAGENFGLIDSDRDSTVVTDDGVRLAVRECGPAEAPLTVVFAHGFSNRMTSFHMQRRNLEQRWGTNVRMVFFDMRGHGLSGVPTPESCTIEQLGRDLETVIEAFVPHGPIVLVGHSMGGMAIMAAARQCPHLFTSRIAGVALLSTTAAGLAIRGLTRNLRNPVVDGFGMLVRAAPGLVQIGRVAARTVIRPILHVSSFGTDVGPTLSKFTFGMIDATSVLTIVKFLRPLEVHDESDALPLMAHLPVLVLGGSADMIIPYGGAVAIAEALPFSDLVRVEGAGHMAHLEFPDIVDAAIVRLVNRSASEAGLFAIESENVG